MNHPRRARLFVGALGGGLIAVLVATVDLRNPTERLEVRFLLAPGTAAGTTLIRSGEPLGPEVRLEIDGGGGESVPDGFDPALRWGRSWQSLLRAEVGSSVTLLGGGATDHGSFSTQWCAGRARRGDAIDAFGYSLRPPARGAAPPVVGALVLTVVDSAGRPLPVTGTREFALGPRPWWQRWLRRPAHRVEVELTVTARAEAR